MKHAYLVFLIELRKKRENITLISTSIFTVDLEGERIV